MKHARFPYSWLVVFVLGTALCLSTRLWAEPSDKPADTPAKKPSLGLQIPDLITGKSNKLAGEDEGKELSLSADFKIADNGRDGLLSVTAVIAKGWHTFSVSQLPGGPTASKITVPKSEQYEVTGPFSAEPQATVKQIEFYDVPVEEHEKQVVWSVPIRLAEGVDPKSLSISVRYDGQVCSEGEGGLCKPIGNVVVDAKYAGTLAEALPVEPGKADGAFRLPGTKLTLKGSLNKSTTYPGEKVKLAITATPDPEWFVYALAKQDPKLTSKPTLIVFTDTAGLQIGEAVPAYAPKVKKNSSNEKEPESRYYPEPITWTIEIGVPKDVRQGTANLVGLFAFQTCKAENCLPPSVAEFRASLQIGNEDDLSVNPLVFSAPTPSRDAKASRISYTTAADLAAGVSSGGLDLAKIKVDNRTSNLSLLWLLPIALLGGFILNFMPCVLPVIGLKILSFVQQAGESRARVFTLNLWYTVGMLAVFMVLATLAVVWNLGWGEQNTNDIFNIVMVSVVFTMGLSFLGVWEIPIPGFVGSGKASELAQKEGPAGAFFKGAITTLLATPCSGPGLATALAWCNGKPPHLVYLVFAFLGLGMALPYLVIGAFPALVKLLPKPGAWMETFKQAMGFVLLGTVVFMFTYMPAALIVPTVALLFGLWAACWWIGRTPLTAEIPQTVRAWVVGAVGAGLVGWFSFSFLSDLMSHRFLKAVDREIALRQTNVAAEPKAVRSEHELPWQPFTVERLKKLTSENKTVMVDFTADWCQTCKFLEAKVLNTKEVRDAVQQHQVETLVADWTSPNPVINDMLTALGSEQIPVLAIFPAGKPNEPIVLIGGYSKATLIKRIEEAAGGADKEDEKTTAMK